MIQNIENTSFQLRSDLHIMRKLWHMSSGLLGLYLYFRSGLDPISMAKILYAVALAGLIVENVRIRSKRVNRAILKVMKPVMRENEKNNMSGLPLYALGTAIALHFSAGTSFSKPEIGILAILFLIFSDPISSYVGILYGKDKILPNKSLQGCVAGFITCYVITLFYGLIHSAPTVDLLIYAVLAGLIGSFSEILSFITDDNFTIPVFSVLGLTLLNQFVVVF